MLVFFPFLVFATFGVLVRLGLDLVLFLIRVWCFLGFQPIFLSWQQSVPELTILVILMGSSLDDIGFLFHLSQGLSGLSTGFLLESALLPSHQFIVILGFFSPKFLPFYLLARSHQFLQGWLGSCSIGEYYKLLS